MIPTVVSHILAQRRSLMWSQFLPSSLHFPDFCPDPFLFVKIKLQKQSPVSDWVKKSSSILKIPAQFSKVTRCREHEPSLAREFLTSDEAQNKTSSHLLRSQSSTEKPGGARRPPKKGREERGEQSLGDSVESVLTTLSPRLPQTCRVLPVKLLLWRIYLSSPFKPLRVELSVPWL